MKLIFVIFSLLNICSDIGIKEITSLFLREFGYNIDMTVRLIDGEPIETSGDPLLALYWLHAILIATLAPYRGIRIVKGKRETITGKNSFQVRKKPPSCFPGDH